MKRKLVNRKAANSIRIGIMAFITAAAPVLSVAAEEGGSASAAPDKGVTVQSGDSGTEQGAEPSAATQEVTEAKTAIETAETELANKGGSLETKDQIGDALDESKTATEAIGSSVDELNRLNGEAEKAKETLEQAVEDKDGLMDTMAGNVADAKESAESAAESTEEKAEEAENLGEEAESLQGNTYANSEAAAAAKAEAQEKAAEAEAALEEAEQADAEAQEKLVSAESSMAVLEAQKTAAETAYKDAEEKVKAAQAKLAELTAIWNGTGEIDNVEAVAKAKEALALAENEFNDAESKMNDTQNAFWRWCQMVEEAEAEAKLAEENLTKKEQGYQAALDVLEGLNSKLAENEREQSGLNNSKAGLEKAAEDADVAKKNADDAVIGAETSAKDAETSAKDAETAVKDAEVAAKNAQAAAESAKAAAADAEKAAEKAQTVAEAYKNAQNQQDTADRNLSAWDGINGILNPIKKEKAWMEYSESADKLAEDRIRCTLAEAVAENESVEFGEWEKGEGGNNYVKVIYQIGDMQYQEYYDYIDDAKGNLEIVKKTPKYESQGDYKGFKFPLEISVDNDEIKYKLKDAEFKGEDVIVSNGGHTVSVALPVETKTYTYGAVKDSYTLIAVTIYGETKYYDEKGNVKKVTLDENGMPEWVDGVPRVNVELKSTENTERTISFANTNTFDGKGTTVPNLTKEDIADGVTVKREAADTAEKEAKAKAEEATEAEEEAREKAKAVVNAKTDAAEADQKWKDAQKILEEAEETARTAAAEKEAADEKLKELTDRLSNLAGAINELQIKIGEANKDLTGKKDSMTAAEEEKKNKDTAVAEKTAARIEAQNKSKDAAAKFNNTSDIKISVEDAYNQVVKAVQALADLTAAANVNEEEYQTVVARYDEAVSNYKDALTTKGESAANVARVSVAAERARRAADAVFAYNTPPTGGDGGTTGGTTGGGGTGGTGGTTAPTTPTAPVVVVPEEAVPLAGAGMTNPAAVRRGAGTSAATADGTAAAGGTGIVSADKGEELAVLEDEETPLASPEEEKETGAIVIEDEETPLAAPIEEQGRMSWWWLLLIAVLGVTGEEMYRRHRKKMQEEMDA